MKNKKLEWLRTGIFLVLTFGLAWLPMILLLKKYTIEEYTSGNKFTLISLGIMFIPAAAHLITRAVTKEGWQGMKLRLNLKNSIRYYVIALVYPLLSGLLSGIALAVYSGDFSFKRIDEADVMKFVPMLLMNIISGSLLMAYCSFGEEFGWRGYLCPKLEKLLNAPAAAVIGGVIWGLWYIPMVCKGFEFGTEYSGFPVAGCVLMCVECTALGILLMWVTQKTGSIFPACIMSSLFTNGSSSLMNLVSLGIKDIGTKTMGTGEYIAMQVPGVLIGAAVMVLIVLDSKKKEA